MRRRILAFHQTSRGTYPGINNIPPERFFQLIGLLREWQIIDPDTDNCNVEGGFGCLTFDDGYESNIEVLLSLCETGFSPMLFIPTGFIGKTNRWEYSSRFFPARHVDEAQIKELSRRGVIIGSHGSSHHALTGMAGNRLREELTDSKKRLEDIISLPVTHISYPFGRADDRVVEMTQECGYTYGYTLDSTAETGNDHLRLARTAIYGCDDYFSLQGRLVKRTRLEKCKSRAINRLAAGTIITSRRLK